MRVDFIKMQGLGNDFIVLDARTHALPPLTAPVVRALADRRTGIGCDQLIVLEPADDADCTMRIFNSDGGEVEACGNATRAVGLLLGVPSRIASAGGLLATRPEDGGISVDLAPPRFGWNEIPLAYAMDTLTLPLGWEGLQHPVAVNVGNPHVVFFVEDAAAIALGDIGPQIETDPVFPERINVNCAQVESRASIRLRVWERGSGLTQACGTGACASAIAAMRRGLVEREVAVHQAGGTLSICWNADQTITMRGPAAESFRGSFLWDDYA